MCQPTHDRHSRRRRWWVVENAFEEIMAEKFPNPKKETNDPNETKQSTEDPKEYEPKQTYAKT